MSEQILGLDIGAYSIKAALFKATFSAFELTDLFESAPLHIDECDEDTKRSRIVSAIHKLIEENNLQPKVVVSSLPGTLVSTRTVSMPLPEVQIAKVLPFEMEAYLPFDLSEVIIDSHTIFTSKHQTRVLAAAVQKSVVAKHLELLKTCHIDPAFVALDSATLFNVSQFTPAISQGSYAIIDIGHSKTSVCMITNGVLAAVRSIYLGGGHITDELRRELDLTLEQAIDVKHQHGIIALPGQALRSSDLQRLSNTIRNVLDPLTQQIQQTLGSFLASLDEIEPGSNRKIEAIYLCGGSSSLKNLQEYFQNYLNVPTTRLELFRNYPEISEKLQHRAGTFAHAIGLSLRAAARGATAKRLVTLNFRKQDFAFARDISGLKNQVIFFGKWAAAVFGAALLSQALRIANLNHELSRVQDLVAKEYRRVVPQEKKIPKSPSAMVKSLQSKSNALKQKQDILTAGLNNTTALGVLLKLSKLTPSDVAVDLQEVAIDRNKITLRGQTDSFEAVDRMASALQSDSAFAGLEKGDIKEASSGKKAFAMTITIETPSTGNTKSKTTKRGGRK